MMNRMLLLNKNKILGPLLDPALHQTGQLDRAYTQTQLRKS